MSILGSPTAVTGGGTYTAETGSNRLVVFSIGRRCTNTGSPELPSITEITWGSLSLTGGTILLAKNASVTNGGNSIAGIYYVKEADIPGGAQTIAVTYDRTMNGSDLIIAFTLGGMNQSSPVDGSGSTQTAAGSTDPFTGSITIADNCIQILSAIFGGNPTITPDAAWTEDQDIQSGNFRRNTQHATGQAAGSLTWTCDLSAATNGSVAVASFAESAGTVWTQTQQHPTQRSTLLRM